MTTLKILYTYIHDDNIPDDTPLVNILDDNLQDYIPDDNPTDTVQYIPLEKIPDDHPLDNILDDNPAHTVRLKWQHPRWQDTR